jgi:hypothetical protein
MPWSGVTLREEVEEEFLLAQRLIDQVSGAVSRWLWACEKRRQKSRAQAGKPTRKAYKAAWEKRKRDALRGVSPREYLRDKNAQAEKRRLRRAEEARRRRAAAKVGRSSG